MGTGGICYNENNFIKIVLQIHNEYRKNHNSPPLEINSKLNKIANSYMNNLINSTTVYSTNIYKNEPLGENNLIYDDDMKPMEQIFNDILQKLEEFRKNNARRI